MVVGAFSDLGWPQFLLHAHVGAHPGLPSLLRCSRLTGPVVLWHSVNGGKVIIDRIQGALPHHCSCRLIGFSVGFSAG